jgi:hypothetical protein
MRPRGGHRAVCGRGGGATLEKILAVHFSRGIAFPHIGGPRAAIELMWALPATAMAEVRLSPVEAAPPS